MPFTPPTPTAPAPAPAPAPALSSTVPNSTQTVTKSHEGEGDIPGQQSPNPSEIESVLCRLIAHELAGAILYNALSCYTMGLSSPQVQELCDRKSSDYLKSTRTCHAYLMLLSGSRGFSLCQLSPCTEYMQALGGCTDESQVLSLLLNFQKRGQHFSSYLSQLCQASYPEISNFFLNLGNKYLLDLHEIQCMLS
jgi:hypothetical protein